jgi:hypothetical protein
MDIVLDVLRNPHRRMSRLDARGHSKDDAISGTETSSSD